MTATPIDPIRTLPLRYRLALRLLPAHVRDEHARELRDHLTTDRPNAFELLLDTLRASPGAHWDVLRQDLVHAQRSLRSAKAFATVAALTLALGIGGNVAFFTLVQSVLLRQLPYIGADRIVDITEENLARGMREFGVAPANYADFVRDTSLFVAASEYNERSGTLRIGETRERIRFLAVDAGFFRVFLERPLLGRTFGAESDVPGNSDIVVSYTFWNGPLGRDPNVIGRVIEVDAKRMRVVGVMPEGFSYPQLTTAFFTPLGLSESEKTERGARFVSAIARLRNNVSVAQASSAMNTVAQSLAKANPTLNGGWTVLVRELRDATVSGVRPALLLAWGAGALVLLIAVANVASLFLTRAVSRQHELSVRSALGARSGRLVRQIATEALLLAAVGAVLGIAVARLLLDVVRPMAAQFVPRMDEVKVSWPVVGYALLLALGTTALLSLAATSLVRAPGLRNSLSASRSGRTRGNRRLQHGIVVAEVALAVFVLVGGALVVRTLSAVLSQPMGFDSSNLLTFRVEPPWPAESNGFPPGSPAHVRVVDSYAALAGTLGQLPGVTSVGAVNRLPLTGNWWNSSVGLPDRPSDSEDGQVAVVARTVTSGYLAAMQTRIQRGRGFLPSDVVGGERVVVVDAEFAKHVWGDADPLGRELLLDGPPNEPRPRARVVGVAEAVHMNRLDRELRPTIYVALSQSVDGFYLNWGMDVVVRGADARLEPQIRRLVRDIFPDAVVFRVSPMTEVVSQSVADRRFQLLVVGFFGVLAMLLATVGVAGTLLLAVRERRREVAVQLALGARPARVWWEVQLSGLALAAVGAVVGVLGAMAGARVFTSLVYDVPLRDPVSLVLGPLLMIVAAFVSGMLPATWAIRVNPVHALRES